MTDAGFTADYVDTPGVAATLRIHAPSGLRFDLISGMDIGQRRPSDGFGSRMRKFAHANLTAVDTEELERFLVDLLGLRVLDRLPGMLTWFRCDADHHGLGIVNHTEAGLHHYAFEVENWGASNCSQTISRAMTSDSSGDLEGTVPAETSSRTTLILTATWWK